MYTLHFAPDNASIIIRILLEEAGAPYETVLVDRSAREQQSASYRKLNPAGLIPVCIIDGVPVFETAAIGLTLSERHGLLAPPPGDPRRADFLKWLFFLSNTLHADLRLLFYPNQYVGEDPAHQGALRRVASERLRRHFAIFEEAYRSKAGAGPYLLGEDPTVVDIYLGLCSRWVQLYPAEAEKALAPCDYPALSAMLTSLESRPSVARSCVAEGIAAPYLTAPTPPDGSVGSAT